jgi:hypothetical protein
MLLGGDEFRRTQGGNNNAYCQDNETSWIDWTDLEQHQEIYRFAQGMIAFRRAHPILSQEQFYTDAEIHWFGPQGGLPNWTDPKEKHFACLIHEDEQRALCLMFNAGADAVDFHLPPTVRGLSGIWRLILLGKRHTICLPPAKEPLLQYPQTYLLKPRSSAILLARKPQYFRGKGVPNESTSLRDTAPSKLPFQPYPIGDLGPAATAFVDFMVRERTALVADAAHRPTGGENSPYQSPSAFAGNPLLLSPDRLVEQGVPWPPGHRAPNWGAGNVNFAAEDAETAWLKRHSSISENSTLAGNLSSTRLQKRSLTGLRIFHCSWPSRRKRARRIGPDGARSANAPARRHPSRAENAWPMTYVIISLSSGSSPCSGKS